jgi:competence protein ComEC
LDALRPPIVVSFLAFLAGVLAGLGTQPGPLLALVAVPLVAAHFLARRAGGVPLAPRHARWLVLAGFCAAGQGHGAAARAAAAGDCRALLPDGAPLAATVVLESGWRPDPDPRSRRPLLPAHLLEVRAAGQPLRGCSGAVRVRLPRDLEGLGAGAEVGVSGRWTRLPGPVVASRWPRAPHLRGYLAVDSARAVGRPPGARHPLLSARGEAERRLERLMGRHSALAHALLLGRRESLDGTLRDRFARAGLVHLLAISGTHVGLIGAVFVLSGRLLRLRRRAVACTSIGLVAAYLAMIGAPPSAVRAGIMLSIALLARALQRPTAPLAVVAAAGFALVAADPIVVLDAGFQLSFAGVVGILLLRRPFLGLVPRGVLRLPGVRWTAEALAVSLAAFLATAPAVAHHFGRVAAVSVASSVPAVPVTGFSLIGIGAAALLDPLSPGLARLVADGAALGLDALEHIVDLSLAVPGGSREVGRPRWWLWVAALLAGGVALDAGARLRSPVRRVVAGTVAAAAWLVLPLAGAVAVGGLEIAFLDVGQGDAVALRTPAGRWLLVDAGMRDASWDAGERRVLPFLRARGVRRLEALILTHPHADHIGGAVAVLRAVTVGRVIEPGLATASSIYLETLDAVEARRVPWHAAREDHKLQIDGVELVFLWPPPAALDRPVDANDISAVIHVRFGAFAALLTGDAPAWVEERLAARHGDALSSGVLKAGHHGSRTSTGEALLDAVRPELVVVSAGARNRHGHPHPEVTSRLLARGIAVARTDRDGTVTVRVEPGGTGWSWRP